MAKKRNPNGFTTDEAQTATLIVTEGYFQCHRVRNRTIRGYPKIRIKMCDRQALEPASRVFATSIVAEKTKRISCKPEDFPPDGHGSWVIDKEGRPAERTIQRLTPLLTQATLRKWHHTKKNCP